MPGETHTEQEGVTGNRPLSSEWKRRGRGEGLCLVDKDMNSWDWILVLLQMIMKYKIL